MRKDVGASFTEYIDFGGNAVAERSPLGLNASMLSQSGMSVYYPAQIVDGSTAPCPWGTDSSTAGAWLQVDLGAGNSQAALQARIYAAVANYTGNYTVQYSDNGSTWSNAATNFVPNQAGWNSTTWPSVGGHRWWRLYLANTPAPGSCLDELQLVAETNYIYFNGKRTARRDPSGAVHYYLSDHLGSTSMVVSSAGAVENESEYYPWGGELKFSTNDNANHYKFTGKERDSETNLDYFGARYYGNALGRFVTADPKMGSKQRLLDPQQLNMYQYSKDSPLSYFDPDGREVRALDAAALNHIQQTLPANVRSHVMTEKNGVTISAKALNGVKSNDANFQALKHMVNAKGVVEVSTGSTTTDKNGKTSEFKYQSDQSVRAELQSKGLTATPGHDYTTIFSGMTYAPNQSQSGNIEVHVTNATGEASTIPQEEVTVTMGHELYVHGGRLLDGKPWEHEDTANGEVNKETHEVEERTRKNAKEKDQK